MSGYLIYSHIINRSYVMDCFDIINGVGWEFNSKHDDCGGNVSTQCMFGVCLLVGIVRS